jgi:nitrogen regulatory protein PII-like uncharacterized protein
MDYKGMSTMDYKGVSIMDYKGMSTMDYKGVSISECRGSGRRRDPANSKTQVRAKNTCQ